MEERELLTFLIGVTVLLITLLQRRKLYLFPALRLPMLAFGLFVLSTLSDVLDNIYSFQVFSPLEHLFYASGCIVILLWIIRLEHKESS